jgi:hypothetical protein
VYISGRFRFNPYWKPRKVTGIDLVFWRFRQDLRNGAIDLGKCKEVVRFTETDSLVLDSSRIVFVWYQKRANIMM